jgi:hypothetical protein
MIMPVQHGSQIQVSAPGPTRTTGQGIDRGLAQARPASGGGIVEARIGPDDMGRRQVHQTAGRQKAQGIMSASLTYQGTGTVPRDQTHTLFAQAMGYVAATAAFFAAGLHGRT